MGIFRSEDMQLYQLIMQKDDAWHTVNELGKLNCLHFIDLNSEKLPHEQQFARTIKLIDETERRVEMIVAECKRHNIDMRGPETSSEFHNAIEKLVEGKDELFLFDQIQTETKDREKFVQNQIQQIKELHKSFNTQVIIKNILSRSLDLLQNIDLDRSSSRDYYDSSEGEEESSLMGRGRQTDRQIIKQELKNQGIPTGKNTLFSPLVGTVTTSEQQRMKKLIFRVSRGKAYTQFFNLNEKIYDYYGNQLDLMIYFVVFPLGSQYLRERLRRVCDSFQGEKFEMPRTRDEIIERFYNGYSLLKIYDMYLRKQKSVQMCLNKLKQDRSLLIGLVWVPSKYARKVQDEILNFDGRVIQMNYVPDHKLTPPTYFELNEFQWAFHEIVVTYGTPNYKEVNPTTFNMVTFPFLFGIMFGDIGHGFLLFLFGAYLCMKSESLRQNPNMIGFLKARYLFLTMGFFATYCGFIYNDMMAMPLNLFGSCYENIPGSEKGVTLKPDCVYPFGFDPKWYVSPNELAFFNSFKMKMAVILGVLQMTLGICMKGMNAIFHRSAIDFLFEFIPQLVFLWCLFGFMDLLIVLKWLTDWTGRENEAPSIITQMINVALKGGEINGSPLVVSSFVQMSLSNIFMLTCLCCVPLMLFVKPLYLKNLHEKEHLQVHLHSDSKQREQHDQDEDEDEQNSLIKQQDKPEKEQPDWYDRVVNNLGEDSKPHAFSEIFIHQFIETIEFVLGTISNTASYLRLWALSLAHGQLAKVFFERTIGMALEENSVIMMAVSFFVFAIVTFFVLMFMDVMECFLHDLRLHWVEFQNKFYKGMGYKFLPLSHQRILFPDY
eukprot:403346660